MSSGKFRQLNTCEHSHKINRLLNLSLDDEWVQDVGEEGAINCEIEVALKGVSAEK
jgi:hypothetical protein